MTLFNRRVFAVKEAMRRAQKPEFQKLWENILEKLVRNEQARRNERPKL